MFFVVPLAYVCCGVVFIGAFLGSALQRLTPEENVIAILLWPFYVVLAIGVFMFNAIYNVSGEHRG